MPFRILQSPFAVHISKFWMLEDAESAVLKRCFSMFCPIPQVVLVKLFFVLRVPLPEISSDSLTLFRITLSPLCQILITVL